MMDLVILLLVAHLVAPDYAQGVNDGAGTAWSDHQGHSVMQPLPSYHACMQGTTTTQDRAYCFGFVRGYLNVVYGLLNGTLEGK